MSGNGIVADFSIFNCKGTINYADMQIWLPIYLIMGLMVALATEFGDLVESCIKRKVGLKDMGKIMNFMKETYPNQYDAKFVGTYVKSKF